MLFSTSVLMKQRHCHKSHMKQWSIYKFTVKWEQTYCIIIQLLFNITDRTRGALICSLMIKKPSHLLFNKHILLQENTGWENRLMVHKKVGLLSSSTFSQRSPIRTHLYWLLQTFIKSKLTFRFMSLSVCEIFTIQPYHFFNTSMISHDISDALYRNTDIK